MPFDYAKASQQIDDTSCGCCTTAWVLKTLNQRRQLKLPNGARLKNQGRARYWDIGNSMMEEDLFPIREKHGLETTMPSSIVRTILTNTRNVHLVLETSPTIETIFNKSGYANEVTALLAAVNNSSNAEHVYIDTYLRRPAATHLCSIGLMGRTDNSLHWLYQEAGNGSWCDPGMPNNRHWFKAHTAYSSAGKGSLGLPLGVNIYIYK
ncbi:hypothetical protein TDB9533_00798 [Thalassocella blandensis]|nr:hypothetical protein TDB9533_00798 [Thalassocella blandensis]